MTPNLYRKNFLPSIVVTISLWVFVLFLIFFVNPKEYWAVPTFFILVFLSLLFTFAIILVNTKAGTLIAALITSIILLRYWGVATPINLSLLIALFVVLAYYYGIIRRIPK